MFQGHHLDIISTKNAFLIIVTKQNVFILTPIIMMTPIIMLSTVFIILINVMCSMINIVFSIIMED